jgi:hypothetical protein
MRQRACDCRACACEPTLARGVICVPSLVLHVWYAHTYTLHAVHGCTLPVACCTPPYGLRISLLHFCACMRGHTLWHSGTAAAGPDETGAGRFGGDRFSW